MLFDIFGKKTKKPDFVEKKEIKPKKYEQKNRLKDTEKEPNKNNPSFVVEHDIKEEVKPKNNDDTTEQSIAIGLDAKEDVKRSSKGFFNSRNEKKADAYRKFQTYIETISEQEIRKIKNLTFLEFKEKENQIFTTLRNGFAQYLSKGAHLDEKTKEIIDFVFGDIKKLPSKGHRYWYYKLYIWQKRELD